MSKDQDRNETDTPTSTQTRSLGWTGYQLTVKELRGWLDQIPNHATLTLDHYGNDRLGHRSHLGSHLVTRYQDGTRFEHVVRKHLEDEGYWCTRSAGSKTKIDLVAIKAGQILLVQCKRDGKCSPAERAAIVALAGCLPTVAVPVLAWKRLRSTTVLLDRLTGTGPKDRTPFTTDQIIETAT